MDDLPNPAPSQPELSELQAKYHDLQQLVSSLLLVLIVISGTLTVYLLRQWRFIKAELDAVAPQATQLLIEHTNNYAMMQDLVKKLAEYGRTHPDFAPIANQHHLNDLLPKPGTASITSSLPVSATSKK
jgi:hypothetical protein